MPHTTSSVCFSCFDTGPKHRNKPKKNEKKFFGFAKKHTEKQPKQIEFRFVSVRTKKKINGFEDPLIENFFGDFFGLLRKICLFRLLQYRSETPKQTETKRKKCFLFSQNKPKNNRNRLSFGLCRSN